MAKEKHADNYDDESTGGAEMKFEPSREKDFELVFKENRSFELHVGRSVFAFAPMGSNVVPEWVVNHPDFIQQSDKFIKREVIR